MKRKVAMIITIILVIGTMSSCGNTAEESANDAAETTTTVSNEIEEDVDDNIDENDNYSYENDGYDYDSSDFKDEYGSVNASTLFYDVLSEEYQNNNELVTLTNSFRTHEVNGVIYRYEYDDWNFMTDDGKYTSWEDVGFDCYLASFDIQSQKYNRVKLFSSNSFPDNVHDDMVIFGNYIYVIKEERIDISDNYSPYNVSLIKYDFSGKEIASCDLGECDPFKMDSDAHMEIHFVSDNGKVYIGVEGFQSVTKIVSSDFKNIDTKPMYNLKVEHGATEERSPSIFAVHGNYIYADLQVKNGDKEDIVIRYDITSKEWSEPIYNIKHGYHNQFIGKYAYYNDSDNDRYVIFDIETGDTIAEINKVFMDYMTVNYTSLPNELAKFFKYGRSYIHKDGSWQEIRIYGDGSTLYDNRIVEMGYDESDNFGISVVDGEHYTLTDSYGIFLRSFKSGESDEVDIVRFDK